MTSTTTIDCELKTCPLEIHWPKAPQHSFNVFAFNWQSATDNDGMSVKWENNCTESGKFSPPKKDSLS